MRHFRDIGHPTMTAANDTAWAALLFGAIDLRDDPLPDEPEDTAECWNCGVEFIPSDETGGLPGGYDLCAACMRRVPGGW
jgi:hypothetical protein